MEIRELLEKEISLELFKDFKRYQKVTKCWRKVDGQWVIKDIAFIEQWNLEEYKQLVFYLKNTLRTSGVVYGAFLDGSLKGFASVEGSPIGSKAQYLDLSSIHVSLEARGSGIGKRLFMMAAQWAREKGAKKLYISAHSSVETQSFYKALGCTEAEEYNSEHVLREPCDCQLEYLL